MYEKFLLFFIAIFALIFMQGCVSSNYSYGREFNSENIKLIIKGTTTSAELEQIVGTPFSKTLINDTDEKWIYIHTKGTTKAQSYIVTMNIESTGQQKMFDVLVRNGIVVNYTYTSGDTPFNYGTQTGK